MTPPEHLGEVRATFEFTWPPSAEDLAETHPGDAPADFARRSFYRVLLGALDKVYLETGVRFSCVKQPTLHP